MSALGIWYLTKLYLIERAEERAEQAEIESIERAKEAKYQQMKAASESYNQAINSRNPESCQEISDQSTREDCEDAYTLQRAHSSPGDTDAICRQMHRSYRIESCLSSITYKKLQDQQKTTPTTIDALKQERAKCESISDKLYRSSCESDHERRYVSSAHARGVLKPIECRELSDPAIQSYCLRLSQQ